MNIHLDTPTGSQLVGMLGGIVPIRETGEENTLTFEEAELLKALDVGFFQENNYFQFHRDAKKKIEQWQPIEASLQKQVNDVICDIYEKK